MSNNAPAAGFPDQEYRAQGATIASRAEVFGSAKLL